MVLYTERSQLRTRFLRARITQLKAAEGFLTLGHSSSSLRHPRILTCPAIPRVAFGSARPVFDLLAAPANVRVPYSRLTACVVLLLTARAP